MPEIKFGGIVLDNQSLDSVKAKKARKKKVKKIILISLVIIIVAVIAAFFLMPKRPANIYTGPVYVESRVERRTIQTTLSSSGTLQPADSYNVTASVSGDILECTFEEGDTVNKDDLLYVIDSSDMENTIDRAQISFDRTLRSYNKIVDSLEDLNIYSDYNGTIIEVFVETGDEIPAGTKIASLRDSDTVLLKVPFTSADAQTLSIAQSGYAYIDGSFERREAVITKIDSFDSQIDGRAVRYVEVSVDNTSGGIFNVTQATVSFDNADCLAAGTFRYNKEAVITAKVSGTVVSIIDAGTKVSANNTLVCQLESESLEDSFKDAKASLDDAQLSFDNTREKLDDYTIEAPITGTVIEKYSKLGDTLGSSSMGQSTLAIIYDMSYLKFDMALDELDISKVAVGQKVMISCEALELSGIEGEITKVSVVGTTSYNSTSYPVTVKIYDPPAGLLAGMNVDAELIIKEAENALSIPVAAVQRGNIVYVKDNGTKAENDNAPAGYRSVRVETGLSNDNYIEIVKGELKEGDIVYVPQAVHETTNIFEQMASGRMPAGMQGGMPGGNMSGARPGGNMGGGMR